jgi:cell division protein ZapA
MKQLEVQIMQQSYLLSCPDGRESRMLEAVERVDTAMCKIRDAGKLKARERIAVLAALNLAFELGEQRLQPAAPAPAHIPIAGADAGHDPRFDHLLQRLDQALGDDGQLL